ncbi:MAG: hypothetical protein M3N57_09005 [Actinomycetota bacterium]|nr:hypothetical protein [Actinomycetota bacterium]
MIIAAWLVLLVAGLVIALITAPFGETVGAFLADVISGAVTGPFVALVWTLMYYRLRGREGGGTGPELT